MIRTDEEETKECSPQLERSNSSEAALDQSYATERDVEVTSEPM